jgi:Uri superfamily endonuclease
MSSFRKLNSALNRVGYAAQHHGASDLDAVPDAKGAYLLLIDLKRSIALDMPGFAGDTVSPGTYLYAGSAYGPGGIKARLRRHFSLDKKPHWHIDRLTSAAAEIRAMAFPEGCECDLVARLSGEAGFNTPLPGFGSSDCAHCASHLLMWRG